MGRFELQRGGCLAGDARPFLACLLGLVISLHCAVWCAGGMGVDALLAMWRWAWRCTWGGLGGGRSAFCGVKEKKFGLSENSNHAQMFDIKNYDLQDLLDIDVNAYLNS